MFRNKEQSEARPKINFELMINLAEQALVEIASANGFDKVLFIGPTGAGKSTLLNYLNGTQYEVFVKQQLQRARAIGGRAEIASTGDNQFQSKTLAPQVLKKSNQNFVYCDLAGLFDSRGLEQQICSAISAMLLSKSKGNIKGIIVALDAPGFDSVKGEAFKKTAKALALIINGKPELMDSVYFVLTKFAPNIQTTVDQAVAENIRHLVEKLEASVAEEDINICTMLKAMLQRPSNIIIADITDRGRSAELIEKSISTAEAKAASLFNFDSFDDAQIEFNATVLSIMRGFLQRKLRIEDECPDQIDKLQLAGETLNRQIAEYADNIAALNIEKELQQKLDQIVVTWVKAVEQEPGKITNQAQAAQLAKELSQAAALLEELKNAATLELPENIGWLSTIVSRDYAERVALLNTELVKRRWCLPWNPENAGRAGGPNVLLQQAIVKVEEAITALQEKCRELNAKEAECNEYIETLKREIEEIWPVYSLVDRLITILGYQKGEYLRFQTEFDEYTAKLPGNVAENANQGQQLNFKAG